MVRSETRGETEESTRNSGSNRNFWRTCVVIVVDVVTESNMRRCYQTGLGKRGKAHGSRGERGESR